MRNKPKAVVLLSGGLDSATVLYLAKSQGFRCFCLAFDYGQRHKKEIRAAREIAQSARSDLRVIKIGLPWKGSALLDKSIKILEVTGSQVFVRRTAYGVRRKGTKNIPSTYVPARNIIFLSFALSYAEAINAGALFIGAHAQDYSGYPDCRPEFYQAFRRVVSTGTKSGIEKRKIQIKTPLIGKKKAEIIRLGAKLGVPFSLTWSCYRGRAKPCGACDSCYYRQKGFSEAGIPDPLS
jgi:7-cyano-7-deazaguanine synthase